MRRAAGSAVPEHLRLGLTVTAALVALALCAPARAASPFAWRGVVEGGSGHAWTHAERMRMLPWLAGHGFNAYIHAPKDDPFQRAGWRNAYPAAELADFATEIRVATGRGVQWIPSISPGNEIYTTASEGTPRSAPVCLSCSSDLAVLMAKFRPFVDDGAKTFMVSLDDDRKLFSGAADVAHYGVPDLAPSAPAYQAAYGRATGGFLTRVLGALRGAAGARATLLTVLVDYAGTADTPYLQGVRSTLDPAVGVLWTGPQVQHTDFAPADATAYAARIGRPPIVWDNWGNTDGCCTVPGSSDHTDAFLGPYRRSPALTGAVRGFFLDPMTEADLNKLPLASAGAWLTDPAGYAADAAWSRELGELAGGDPALAGSLRAWAETFHWTKSDIGPDLAAGDPFGQVAPTFRAAAQDFLAAYTGDAPWSAASAALLHELDLTGRATDSLAALPDRDFFAAAGPFVRAGSRAAQVGELGEELAVSERPTAYLTPGPAGSYVGHATPPDPATAAGLRAELTTQGAAERAQVPCAYGFHGATGADGSYVCDPGRRTYLDTLTPGNAMDAFLDRIGTADRAWAGRTAASSVSVAVDGNPVSVAPDGTFPVPSGACGRAAVITDGAGGTTMLGLPPCAGFGTAPPETSITAVPAGFSTFRGGGASFSSSQDGSSFRCALDQAPARPCSSPIGLSGLADGVHVLSVAATGPGGTSDPTPARSQWTIDTRPPVTSITRAPATLTAHRSATVSFAADEAGSTFACSIDRASFTPCTSPDALAGLADGPRSFAVRATDPAGNVDASPSTTSWVVDATPPQTRITAGPYLYARSGAATLRFSASQHGAAFTCALDRGSFRRCRSPAFFRGLRLGSHVVAVRARDPVGNVDPTPAVRQWLALPALGLRVRASRQSLQQVIARGLELRIGCARTCEIGVAAQFTAQGARALRLRRSRDRVVALTRKWVRRYARSVRIHLSATARHALIRSSRVTLMIHGTATDTWGNTGFARLKVTVLRRRR